jgi:hypothetical protein
MTEPTEPVAPPAPWTRPTVITLLLLCGLTLAVLLPPALSTGWNLEEIGGMLRVAPIWEFPGDEPPAAEREPGDGFRTYWESRYPLTLPVWGVLHGDDFYPLMIDGHIGAIPGYPYRWLFDAFGPNGPRVLSVLTGLAMLVSFFVLARRLYGFGAALIGSLLLITTPLFAFTYTWNNHSEQWSAGFPALALLAAIHFARNGRTRWLILGALLAGAAVAAKNTAVWTLLAGLAATAAFRMWPRVNARQVALALGAACLPMLPQFAMIAWSPSTGTLLERVSRIPAPWEAFTPSRVANIGENFIEAFLSWTDYLVPYVSPATAHAHTDVPGLAVVLVATTLAATGTAFLKRLPRATRAFGLGFALLLLQYMAFYYVGQSAFILLVMWIPLGVSGVLWLLVRSAWSSPRASVRVGVLLAVAVALGAWTYNNVLELWRYERSTNAPTAALWNRDAQISVAEDLEARGALAPWTMSFASAGVLELVSDGAVRPRHAYPIFATVCADAAQLRQEDAWLEVLERMGPGRHWVLLTPEASKVEISPCRAADPVITGFERAMETSGTVTEVVRRWVSDDGVESFRLVALDVPEALPAREGDWP